MRVSTHKTCDSCSPRPCPPGTTLRVHPLPSICTLLFTRLKSRGPSLLRNLPTLEPRSLYSLCLDALPPQIHFWKPPPRPWPIHCSKGHLLGPQDVGLRCGLGTGATCAAPAPVGTLPPEPLAAVLSSPSRQHRCTASSGAPTLGLSPPCLAPPLQQHWALQFPGSLLV